MKLRMTGRMNNGTMEKKKIIIRKGILSPYRVVFCKNGFSDEDEGTA